MNTILLEPFEPTARLALDRYGAVNIDGPSRMELEVGGYLAVYVGRPGEGNLEGLLPAPPGERTMHSTQAIGGAYRVRDQVEAINLAVRALATLRDLGVLDTALRHLHAAEMRGQSLGARQ